MQKICGVKFFCLRPEKRFFGKSSQKNENCQFKPKFGTETNLNMRNLMMLTFPVFEYKYLSWVSLVQKFKIVCSK